MAINRIDHVGVYVSNMDAAVNHLESVGFIITPTSGVLSASAVPGGEKLPIGTTNRVAVLGPSFLELVTSVDPDVEARGPKPWRVRPTGEWGSGPCIVGFGTDSAAAADATWRSNGIPTTGVVQFQAEMKAVKSGVSVADVVIVERDQTPEGLVLAVEFPPGDRRSAADRAHANGAAAITGVYMTTDDPAVVERYEALLGARAQVDANGSVIHVPDAIVSTRIHFGTAAQLQSQATGLRDDIPTPCVSGIIIGVKDLEVARTALDSSDAEYTEDEGALVVTHPASNLVLRLEEL